MKKSTILMLMTILSLTFAPSGFAAISESVPNITTNREMPERVKTLLARLDEIKQMDKSKLTRIEKRTLRKEVKEIKTTLRDSDNGVYLSAGAIVIVTLLLILIL